jgi:hypothetical protein
MDETMPTVVRGIRLPRAASAWFLRAILVVTLVSSSLGQTAAPVAVPEPYDSILDLVFPWPEADLRRHVVTIAMRFRPSFSPESAIVLRFDDQGRATVTYSKAGIRISRFLSRSGVSDMGDRAVLERALQVETKNHTLNPIVAGQYLDDFWNALARSPRRIQETAGKFQLDGTNYELRVTTGLVKWHLSIQDEETQNEINGEMAIVQWMNAIRVAIGKIDESR